MLFSLKYRCFFIFVVMVCNIDDKICDIPAEVNHIDKKQVTMEKVLSTICFIAGAIFLVAALCGMWRHFFTMGLCFAVGIMIADESRRDENKKRHED